MIAVIDGDSLIHILAWVHRDDETDEGIRNHVKTFMNNILANSYCDEYISFVQGEDHKNFRKELFPIYKSHRAKQPSEHIDRWKGTIIDELHKSFGTYVLNKIESDDAVFITKNRFDMDPRELVIVENDKDLGMIPGRHYNPFKPDMEVRYWKVSERQAEMSYWRQVITGDASDMSNEFCGVFRVGEKGAIKLLKEADSIKDYPSIALKAYTDKYGSTEGGDRFARTLGLIQLLRKPTTLYPETASIMEIEPRKIEDSVDALFEDTFEM